MNMVQLQEVKNKFQSFLLRQRYLNSALSGGCESFDLLFCGGLNLWSISSENLFIFSQILKKKVIESFIVSSEQVITTNITCRLALLPISLCICLYGKTSPTFHVMRYCEASYFVTLNHVSMYDMETYSQFITIMKKPAPALMIV